MEAEDSPILFARNVNYNPSLYLRKAFVIYLTAFFRDNPRLGYQIYDEKADVDKKFRSLLITPTYNMTLPDKGHLPAIFVERGPIDSGMVTGASRYIKRGRGENSELYKTPLATTIICHCLTDDDEEADRLANLVRVAVELDYHYFKTKFAINLTRTTTDHVQPVQPGVYRSSVMAPVILEVEFDIERPKGETLREIEMWVDNEYKIFVGAETDY